MSRVAITDGSGMKNFFCGPEASRPTCARSSARHPELKRLLVAAGLNSVGVLTGGGIGRVLAHWITTAIPM